MTLNNVDFLFFLSFFSFLFFYFLFVSFLLFYFLFSLPVGITTQRSSIRRFLNTVGVSHTLTPPPSNCNLVVHLARCTTLDCVSALSSAEERRTPI